MSEKKVVSYNGREYPVFPSESQRVFKESGIDAFMYFPEDRLLIASESFRETFDAEQFYPSMPDSIIPKILDSDVPRFREFVKKIDSYEEKAVAEIHAHDGKLYRVTMFPVKNGSSGKPEIYGGFVKLIDVDKRQDFIIETLHKEFASIYRIDCETENVTVISISDAIRKEYGKHFDLKPKYREIIETYIQKTVISIEQDEMRDICSMENLKKTFLEKDIFEHDFRGRRDGNLIYCRMKAINIARNQSFILAFSDITHEKMSELEKIAYIDSLTGGNNYHGFKKRVQDIGKPGFIVAVDIYQFKLVNSVKGVDFGDTVLKRVWGKIFSVKHGESVIGRINADHFVAYNPVESKEEIIAKIDALTDELAKLSLELGCPKLVPYFGIVYWDSKVPIEQAYNETTMAKHAVKEHSDVNYLFYTKEIEEQKIHEKKLEDSFWDALKDGCFEIFYQPKIDPFKDRIVGAEALVRWRKDGSLLPPGKFIPLFEKDGFIKDLDEYIFASVCKFIKSRLKRNLEVVPISVNVSRASLFFDGIALKYRNILEDYGVPPELVPLEITESAASNNSMIRDTAKDFKHKGFLLCVDDFGAGYSSLALLNSLNFDNLKLDKTLIDGIHSETGFKLIKHTIALAKDLQMTITAEGVEESKQLESLKLLNCDFIQGYIYSKPVSQEEFELKLGS